MGEYQLLCQLLWRVVTRSFARHRYGVQMVDSVWLPLPFQLLPSLGTAVNTERLAMVTSEIYRVTY